ncbi:MAG: enoyl-CoA hydratase/isomerase family protein [Candidatus Thorarchaeota archaeon SMTZ1-83]
MMEGEIIVTRTDPIATVTISRPSKLNAVTREMLESFDEKVGLLTNDPQIAGIIFTGVGEKSFTAGFDLTMMAGLQGKDRTEFFKLLERSMKKVKEANTCLTLAAINGYAIGFGAMLAVACDFRFFSKNAALRFPEVDLGIFPGAGASSNLLGLVGPSRAKDIILSGRMVHPEEAYEIGLANGIFEHSELLDKAMEYMKALAGKDPKILLRAKTLIDGMTGKTVFGAAEMESAFTEEWLLELEKE